MKLIKKETRVVKAATETDGNKLTNILTRFMTNASFILTQIFHRGTRINIKVMTANSYLGRFES